MRILLIVVKKMSIAALHGKAIRQLIKSIDTLDYRTVDHNIGESDQAFPPLLLIMWNFHQFLRFYKGFQSYFPSYKKIGSMHHG